MQLHPFSVLRLRGPPDVSKAGIPPARWAAMELKSGSPPPNQTHEEGDYEDRDENIKQDLSNPCRGARDATKTEDGGDDCYD